MILGIRRASKRFAVRRLRAANRAIARYGFEIAPRVAASSAADGALNSGAALLLGLSARGPITVVCVGAGHVPGLGDPDPAVDFMRAAPDRIARALLIEPVPFRLDGVRSLIGSDGRFRYLATAIARGPAVLRLWQIDEWADTRLREVGLPSPDGRSGGHGWTSSDREHVIGLLAQHLGLGAAHASDHVRSLDVPCSTLDAVLATEGFEDVDYLQVDTEGLDDEVILTLDLDRIRPKVIRCEFVHVPPRRRDRLATELAGHGYGPPIRIGDLDALFVLEGDLVRRRNR